MNRNRKSFIALKFIVAVFLMLPLIVTLIYSFSERWVTLLPDGFTIKYYIKTITNLVSYGGFKRNGNFCCSGIDYQY